MKISILKYFTLILVLAMLITGSLNTITKKCQFSTYSTGIGGKREAFAKPYLQSLVMFSGETLCLLYYVVGIHWRKIARKRRKKLKDIQKLDVNINLLEEEEEEEEEEYNEQGPLLSVNSIKSSDSDSRIAIERNIDSISSKSPKKVKKRKPSVFLFLPPACCDVLGTTFAGLSLIYLSASIFQMLRGSILVFTGIFSFFILRRSLKSYQWIGIFIVCIGLVLVGVASFLSDEASVDQSVTTSLLGILFCLVGQACNGFQFVLEESFLKSSKVNVRPEQVVGTEGVWGVMIMGLIILPYCYVLPGSDHGGRAEDTANSMVLIWNNPLILVFLGLYWLSIAFYNFFSLTMAKHLTSIHRVLIDTCRTIAVWGVELVMYWIFSGSKDYQYGESWNNYSFLELAGFCFLVLGTMVHNHVLRVPSFAFMRRKK